MKVADEVEAVDGIPVHYGGDYDGLWDPGFTDVGYIGNFDGQSESSEYEDPQDFFYDEGGSVTAVEETATPVRLQQDSGISGVPPGFQRSVM